MGNLRLLRSCSAILIQISVFFVCTVYTLNIAAKNPKPTSSNISLKKPNQGHPTLFRRYYSEKHLTLLYKNSEGTWIAKYPLKKTSAKKISATTMQYIRGPLRYTEYKAKGQRYLKVVFNTGSGFLTRRYIHTKSKWNTLSLHFRPYQKYAKTKVPRSTSPHSLTSYSQSNTSAAPDATSSKECKAFYFDVTSASATANHIFVMAIAQYAENCRQNLTPEAHQQLLSAIKDVFGRTSKFSDEELQEEPYLNCLMPDSQLGVASGVPNIYDAFGNAQVDLQKLFDPEISREIFGKNQGSRKSPLEIECKVPEANECGQALEVSPFKSPVGYSDKLTKENSRVLAKNLMERSQVRWPILFNPRCLNENPKDARNTLVHEWLHHILGQEEAVKLAMKGQCREAIALALTPNSQNDGHLLYTNPSYGGSSTGTQNDSYRIYDDILPSEVFPSYISQINNDTDPSDDPTPSGQPSPLPEVYLGSGPTTPSPTVLTPDESDTPVSTGTPTPVLNSYVPTTVLAAQLPLGPQGTGVGAASIKTTVPPSGQTLVNPTGDENSAFKGPSLYIPPEYSAGGIDEGSGPIASESGEGPSTNSAFGRIRTPASDPKGEKASLTSSAVTPGTEKDSPQNNPTAAVEIKNEDLILPDFSHMSAAEMQSWLGFPENQKDLEKLKIQVIFQDGTKQGDLTHPNYIYTQTSAGFSLQKVK